MGYPVNYLIDYHSLSSREEIQRAFEPTYAHDWGNVGSLKGRLVCVLKLATHIVSIPLKPIYYLAIGIIGFLSTTVAKKIASYIENYAEEEGPFADGIREAIQNVRREPGGRSFFNLLEAFKNEEYVRRTQTLYTSFICTAPSALVSQCIQAGKAAAGIIHPGYYFANDELGPLFQRLKRVAQAVDCPADLVEKLDRGAEIRYQALRESPAGGYYHALFKRDLAAIAEKLEGDLTPAHKLSVLSMLHSDPDEPSGIEGCSPAFGRIIEQMKNALSVPEDPNRIIPWLLDSYKMGIIDRMIFKAENDQLNQADWGKIVAGLAHDQAHKGNVLTAILGRDLGLPEEIVLRAERDPIVNGIEIDEEDRQQLLKAFRDLATEEDQLNALMAKINSQPDGSAGLKPFRNHIFQRLTQMLTPEELGDQDPVFYATEKYYLNQGKGDPSQPQFTDLNREAIARYKESLPLNNPRQVVIDLRVA